MGSGKIDLTEFQGLVTAPGLLQRSPASALVANNWEFPAPGVIRKRRGIRRLSGNAGGPVWKIFSSRLMGNNVLCSVGTGTGATQLRYGDGTAALSAVSGTVSSATRPRDTRAQMAVVQRNHYLTANEGPIRVESNISARFAGMPRGLGCFATNLFFGMALVAGTTFADGIARSYRVTWHRKDADNVELGGAPSARFTCCNATYIGGYGAGVAKNFALLFHVPREMGITTAIANGAGYYWRLWGTPTFTEATQLGTDECYLIAEKYLTNTDITNGFVAYTDSTPDSFLQSSPRLHTNLYNFPPSEVGIRQGIVNEDAPPPVANDVAYWQDVLWYGDLTQRAQLTVSMLALPADGDTVIVSIGGTSVTLTARNAPASATEFKITSAAATTAINIRQTAMSLASVINVNLLGSGLGAYTVSTSSSQPGLIFLEANVANAASVNFVPSATAKWQGLGGFDLATAQTPQVQSNGLMFSKVVRGDAVPPINLMTAGPNDARILRVVPFEDKLLLFTDYGIFYVTGRTYADFTVYPFDLGYRLLGRDLVVLCDEKIYAWCLEGIVEIDGGGVKLISTPIEPTIEAAFVSCGGTLAAGRSTFAALGFATAYRTQHQVRFHYPQANDSANLNGCHYWLSFDTRTRAWATGEFTLRTITGYLDSRCCAAVRFTDDLLCYGSWSTGADTWLFLERRAYDSTDFGDDVVTGATDPITSTLRMQFAVPDEAGAQHWQQVVLNWDATELSWRTLPASIALTYRTEVDTATDTPNVVSTATRSECPVAARRGQRLSVQLVHNASEYAGIVGISVAYRQGSRFARRVTQ